MLKRKLLDNWITVIEVLVIAVTVCLFAAAAHAQTTDRMGLDHGTAAPFPVVLHHQAGTFPRANTKPQHQKPPIPRDARWATRIWRVSEFTAVAAWQADAGTTHVFLTNGSGCEESAALMGPRPSDAKLYGITTAIYAGFLGLQEFTHRRARDSANIHVGMSFVNGFVTMAHTLAASSNRHCL